MTGRDRRRRAGLGRGRFARGRRARRAGVGLLVGDEREDRAADHQQEQHDEGDQRPRPGAALLPLRLLVDGEERRCRGTGRKEPGRLGGGGGRQQARHVVLSGRSRSRSRDGGDGGGGGMATRGANYFFGFLITFVVLLLIFVGCGIGSRRRFLARRRDGMFDGLDPWGQPRREEQKEPVFYEHPIGEPIIEDKWMYTTVRCGSLLSQTNTYAYHTCATLAASFYDLITTA